MSRGVGAAGVVRKRFVRSLHPREWATNLPQRLRAAPRTTCVRLAGNPHERQSAGRAAAKRSTARPRPAGGWRTSARRRGRWRKGNAAEVWETRAGAGWGNNWCRAPAHRKLLKGERAAAPRPPRQGRVMDEKTVID